MELEKENAATTTNELVAVCHRNRLVVATTEEIELHVRGISPESAQSSKIGKNVWRKVITRLFIFQLSIFFNLTTCTGIFIVTTIVLHLSSSSFLLLPSSSSVMPPLLCAPVAEWPPTTCTCKHKLTDENTTLISSSLPARHCVEVVEAKDLLLSESLPRALLFPPPPKPVDDFVLLPPSHEQGFQPPASSRLRAFVRIKMFWIFLFTILFISSSVRSNLLLNGGFEAQSMPFTASYTGANQFYTVPASGVSVLRVKMWGGGGGGGFQMNQLASAGGGAGGFVECYVSVIPLQSLKILVAGGGTSTAPATNSPGGFGGGGEGMFEDKAGALNGCGGGGGRSAMQMLGYITSGVYDDIVTAGGGGGGYADSNFGGAGGGLMGLNGKTGNGGTQTAGGTSGGGASNEVYGISQPGSKYAGGITTVGTGGISYSGSYLGPIGAGGG